MLDEKRLLAIQLIAEGRLNKTEIAEKCDRSRQWLYQILDEEDVKAELNRLLQKIKLFGENVIKSNLEKSIMNIVMLANNATSEKVRLDANTYLTNRILGTPTSKLEVTENNNQQEPEDPLAGLDDLDYDNNESEENN